MATQLQRRAGVVLVLLCSGARLLMAQPGLSVSVNPRFTFQPGNARVKVAIDQNADNRSLRIEADGPDFYTGSVRQLEGASSPRVQLIALKALPPGNYVITATLTRADGSTERAATTIEVLESAALYVAASKSPRVRTLGGGR